MTRSIVKDCIYLGTYTDFGDDSIFVKFFTFELFELSDSSIYKQVQASEFIPIVFRRRGRGCFIRSQRDSMSSSRIVSENGTGLGHVQGTIV